MGRLRRAAVDHELHRKTNAMSTLAVPFVSKMGSVTPLSSVKVNLAMDPIPTAPENIRAGGIESNPRIKRGARPSSVLRPPSQAVQNLSRHPVAFSR